MPQTTIQRRPYPATLTDWYDDGIVAADDTPAAAIERRKTNDWDRSGRTPHEYRVKPA